MTAPTHVISGLAAAVFAGRVIGVSPDAVSLIALIFGCLAPDIDGTGAITRPGTILRRFLGRTLANLLDAVFKLLVAVVQLVFRHRGFIHSPLLAASIVGFGVFLGHAWLVWFGAGYVLHLVGDAMTVGGIPLWGPFSTERVSFSGMRTGSRKEAVIASVLLLFKCVCGWTLLPQGVKDTHRELYYAMSQVASESSQ